MTPYVLNRRIAALLDDPLISLMMEADGVDRAGLARQLGDVGRSVQSRLIRDEKPHRAKPGEAWGGRAFALCGACAP